MNKKTKNEKMSHPEFRLSLKVRDDGRYGIPIIEIVGLLIYTSRDL